MNCLGKLPRITYYCMTEPENPSCLTPDSKQSSQQGTDISDLGTRHSGLKNEVSQTSLIQRYITIRFMIDKYAVHGMILFAYIDQTDCNDLGFSVQILFKSTLFILP